jgi:hypothetical protein
MQLDSNTILGIPGVLGCSDYKHAIITQDYESWPCGVPVVYPAEHDLSQRRNSTTAMSLFTPNQHGNGRNNYSVPNVIMQPLNLKPLIDNHETLYISEFDPGKWDRLTEFVRDVGGISLVVEPSIGRRNMSKSVREIERKFKFSALYYYNAWGSKKLQEEEDRFVCVLTFLDLPYCIPLFNMRRVDGLCLSFSGAVTHASLGYGALDRVFHADFVFSNYEDNIFVIDGVTVNKPRSTDNSIFKEMEKMAARELEVGKTLKKKKLPYDKESVYGRKIREMKEMKETEGFRSGGTVNYTGGDIKKKYGAITGSYPEPNKKVPYPGANTKASIKSTSKIDFSDGQPVGTAEVSNVKISQEDKALLAQHNDPTAENPWTTQFNPPDSAWHTHSADGDVVMSEDGAISDEHGNEMKLSLGHTTMKYVTTSDGLVTLSNEAEMIEMSDEDNPVAGWDETDPDDDEEPQEEPT